MKAKNIYLLLAREVSTDDISKMNSIIKIIDRFQADIVKSPSEKDKKPTFVIPVSYAIASAWILDKPVTKQTSLAFNFEIVEPLGTTLATQQQSSSIPKGSRKVAFNITSSELPVTISGEYLLKSELKLGSNTLAKAEYPFEVQLNETP